MVMSENKSSIFYHLVKQDFLLALFAAESCHIMLESKLIIQDLPGSLTARLHTTQILISSKTNGRIYFLLSLPVAVKLLQYVKPI